MTTCTYRGNSLKFSIAEVWARPSLVAQPGSIIHVENKIFTGITIVPRIQERSEQRGICQSQVTEQNGDFEEGG